MQDWKEIYVQHKFPLYLFSQTDLADVLKKRNWPSRLYKYRSFSDFHTNALSDFSVWLSTPIGFNDTRDCSYNINPHRQMNFILSKSKESILELAEILLLDERQKASLCNSKAPHTDIMNIIRQTMPGAAADELSELYNYLFEESILSEFNKKLKQRFHVCSLSAKRDSPLMWAHYANEHKGFCVEYNVEDLPGNSNEFFDMIHPVFYTDNIFDATSYLIATAPKLKNPEFLQQAALIKTKDWAYEDEWRLMVESSGEEGRLLRFEKPSAIYLGERTETDKIEWMLKFCKSHHITCFLMKTDPKSVGMAVGRRLT